VCILAKGSGDCASPAYHDHPSQRLLLNLPDATYEAYRLKQPEGKNSVASLHTEPGTVP
jgi:hypothetical protein